MDRKITSKDTISLEQFQVLQEANKEALRHDPTLKTIIVGNAQYELDERFCPMPSNPYETVPAPSSGAYINDATGDVYVPYANHVKVFNMSNTVDVVGILGYRTAWSRFGTVAFGGEWEKSDLQELLGQFEDVSDVDHSRFKTLSYAMALESAEDFGDLKIAAADYFVNLGVGESAYYDKAFALTMSVNLERMKSGDLDAIKWVYDHGKGEQKNAAHDVLVKLSSVNDYRSYRAAEILYYYGFTDEAFSAMHVLAESSLYSAYSASDFLHNRGFKDFAVECMMKIAESGNSDSYNAALWLFSNADQVQIYGDGSQNPVSMARDVVRQRVQSGSERYQAAIWLYDNAANFEDGLLVYETMMELARNDQSYHAAGWLIENGVESKHFDTATATFTQIVAQNQVDGYGAARLLLEYGNSDQRFQALLFLVQNSGDNYEYSLSTPLREHLEETDNADQGYQILQILIKRPYGGDANEQALDCLKLVKNPKVAVDIARRFLKEYDSEDQGILEFISEKERDCASGNIAFK